MKSSRTLMQSLGLWTFVALGLGGCAAPGPTSAPSSAPASAPAEVNALIWPDDRSVRPGINDAYQHADPARFVERFEHEGREVFDQRAAIVADLGLGPGETVADIGAGTGLYVPLLAAAVGEAGRVYAVEIVPEFVEHIRRRADEAGLKNVESRLCSDRSVELPAGVLDAAFACDVYHHFEYPRATMTSLHTALKPGGEFFVIDFERIPGQSSAWVLDHVRAGKETVIAEIESFGFEYVGTAARSAQLRDNYFLRFRKRG